MRYRNIFFASMTLSTILLGACSSEDKTEHATHADSHTVKDLREETAARDIAPAFLKQHDTSMTTIYLAAAQHQELLEQMPCYCGCGESAGHTSNYDCFIHENEQDGTTTWDDHGTRCGTCLEIAAESINAYSAGKSVKEIRKMIDEKYAEGYAEPTPTPSI